MTGKMTIYRPAAIEGLCIITVPVIKIRMYHLVMMDKFMLVSGLIYI